MKLAFKIIATIVILGALLYVGAIFYVQYEVHKAGLVLVGDFGDERINFDDVTLHIPKGWAGSSSNTKIDSEPSIFLEKESGGSLEGRLISAHTLEMYKKADEMGFRDKSTIDITSRYGDFKELISVTQSESGPNSIRTDVLYASKSGAIDISVVSPRKGPLPNTEIADEILSMFRTK